jgi:hypothetical protein
VSPLDPDTSKWTCCGQSVHATGCSTNRNTYRYGSEPPVSALALMPPPTCRDCGVHVGQHDYRCCLATCRRCEQQLICACATTTLELVQ